jgi:ubiquitin carboxyl-terminal hydrolase 4/11/15
MNCALQCLSNTEDLTKYILKDYFKRDINHVNKLGYNGELIYQYSKLIKLLWEIKINHDIEKDNSKTLEYITVTNPKEFRNFIGKILNQFNSSKQQDSHEFLSLFLDNLHEDINRITNKPYLELEERKEGESDKEASERWWKIHRLRENSIISDLFHGQLKSTISCNICKNTSITYNPFMFLSLSLPVSPLLIKLKIFYKNQSFLIHIPI